ncbi:MAG: glycosyltransferase [Nocardioidaceae bacterium]|nr:glycosyltransferase [Nocardioidaceae bacterium]
MTRPLMIEAEPAFRTEFANPYNARLYRAMSSADVVVRDLSYWRLLTRRTDIVHLHWPELTFLSGSRTSVHAARLLFFYLFLRVAKVRGTKLFWTVHNVTPHEERSTARLRALHQRLLLGNVDAILALTADGLQAARLVHPKLREVPGFVTPHGHYRDSYDLGIGRDKAREVLGVDPYVRLVLSLGQIRPYRNIPHLMKVFGRFDDPDARLAVAGRAAPAEHAAELRTAAEGDARVTLELSFLEDPRMACWLRAADLVVLPYRAIQNSGSAILAISADRPVLVPDLGAMRELADQVGHDWVFLYDDDLDEEDLSAALDLATSPDRPRAPDLAALDWEAVAASTVAAYREVRGA